jgi:hypothetical protein
MALSSSQGAAEVDGDLGQQGAGFWHGHGTPEVVTQPSQHHTVGLDVLIVAGEHPEVGQAGTAAVTGHRAQRFLDRDERVWVG